MKAEPSPRRIRLLVVEDDANSAFVLVRMLAKLGVDSEALPDGSEAVSRLATLQFDGAIVDLNLPYMDGLELGQTIRAWESPQPSTQPRLILFLTTASIAPASLDEGIGQVFNGYVVKPFSLAGLRSSLQSYFPSTFPLEGSKDLARPQS